METLGIGIIGYGGFGPFLHNAWSAVDGVRVTAVADSDERRRPEGVAFFANWRDLIGDSDVDIVAIATPPFTHAEMAVAAMEAGKHVLVEKPLATHMEDARTILAVQQATGRVAAVNHMLRFNPIVEALQAWSRNGCFGRLRRVVVENYAQDESLPPEHWFWNREVSGGILVEHAVHFIDIVNGCTDAAPARIDGWSIPRNEIQEDRVMASVVYEDGLTATHYHAFARPNFFEHTSMRFVFDLAQLYVEGWVPLEGHVSGLTNPETRSELDRLPGLSVTSQQPVPIDGGRIRSGGEPYTVDTWTQATFRLAEPKPEAYTAALQALMADLAACIRDASRSPRVSLKTAAAALQIAVTAAEQARDR